MSCEYVPVAPLEAVPENGNKAFDVAGTNVLVCRTKSAVYAVHNQCTHAQSPLEGGRVRGHFLFCPLHGARFDLRDGSTRGQLTQTPVRTFPVRVVDGMIEVSVSDEG